MCEGGAVSEWPQILVFETCQERKYERENIS